MLKWTASVVLATKKYRTREEAFAAFYSIQDGTKVTNAATHVATAAPNINRTPFTRKDAI